MVEYVVSEIKFRDRSLLIAALLKDQRIEELMVERAGEESMVGRVYAGVVDTVSKNIGGAFLDIGSMLCYVPLSRHSHLSPSQKVLVQITKDASGRKECVGTLHPLLSGRYAVVGDLPGEPSFSRKLTDAQKDICRKWLSGRESSHRILVRTNAARAEKAAFLKEVEEMEEELTRIRERAGNAKKGELLYAPEPFYVRFLRDLYAQTDRCLTNIPRIAGQLSRVTGMDEDSIYLPDAGQALSLDELYGLTRELDRLSGRQVYLPGGGFLVIEQTEAFVSVDVNTGKCQKGRIPEETYRKVNLEAAEELSRQLRLRNLSGMILVDFITLSREEHKVELINVMRKLVRSDHIHTEVVDLTPLGIMEILRQKTSKPLSEVLSGIDFH